MRTRRWNFAGHPSVVVLGNPRTSLSGARCLVRTAACPLCRRAWLARCTSAGSCSYSPPARAWPSPRQSTPGLKAEVVRHSCSIETGYTTTNPQSNCVNPPSFASNGTV